jgi:hypothetical protein
MLDMPDGFAEYADWMRWFCWVTMLSGSADCFLYAGSLCWLDSYASYADCLAMLTKLAGCLCWLYRRAGYSGYVLWLEVLAVLDGGLCCISWLALLVGCLTMTAIHASWLANLAFCLAICAGIHCWLLAMLALFAGWLC